MKTSTLLIITIALTFALFSCSKINESIQRNVIITPDTVTFTVPAITDTINTDTLGAVAAGIDLDALIKAKLEVETANQAAELGAGNISTIRISGFTLKLSDTTSVNNLMNFESIQADLLADGLPPVTVAAKAGNPETNAVLLNIPVSRGDQGIDHELKPYLTGTNIKYTITAILRHPTTKTLTAKIVPQYTITLTK